MTSFLVKSFDESKIQEVISFAKEKPWKPIWSEELMLEFLTRLISSSKMVIDLFSDDHRTAVAVLVDKIQNPGNNACLEILGAHNTIDISSFYLNLVEIAKSSLPESRSGFFTIIYWKFSTKIQILQFQNLKIGRLVSLQLKTRRFSYTEKIKRLPVLSVCSGWETLIPKFEP